MKEVIKMQILAHRGYWNSNIPPNSPLSLRTALENGYGFESDVRDYMGRMVISHNIADASCQDAEEVFKWLSEYGDRYCFAINIKADGLKEILIEYFDRYNIKNYFLFDMSVPQMVEFAEMGLRFFTRRSEYETEPVMYEQAAGVWTDGFKRIDWITEELLRKYISDGKEVCLVSPDLHGKTDYKLFWDKLRCWNIDFSKVLLCTDHPDEAREFFKDKI